MRMEIKEEIYWLWHTVDEQNQVSDILMQKRRDDLPPITARKTSIID